MPNLNLEFDLDEEVYDGLTRKHTKIVGINIGIGKCDDKRYHGAVFGYWLDDDYLGGGRHPWEIDHLPPKKSQFHDAFEPNEEPFDEGG